MNRILIEALEISREFESATFVGAVAVILHADRKRRTLDLDFAVNSEIADDDYLDLGYVLDAYTHKKYSPRGYKIDVYDRRGLNDIPLDYILDRAKTFCVGGGKLRAISLEGLIVSKFRSWRPKDRMDLRRIARNCGEGIDWDEIDLLAKHDVELAGIRKELSEMM